MSVVLSELHSNSIFTLLAVAALVLLSFIAAGHALLRKREPRAAMAWIIFSVIAPLLGPLIYFLFGINRVELKAQRYDDGAQSFSSQGDQLPSNAISNGNTVRPLFNGDVAYPAMIKEIRLARHSIYLSQYIFEARGVGQQIIEAMGDAVTRGVCVRVLVDGVGTLYGWTNIVAHLRQRGIRTAKFLPLGLRASSVNLNLRNHRKLLIVDHRIAFTGGMNIRPTGIVQETSESKAIADSLFRFEGPVVEELESVFRNDWFFSSRELLESASVETTREGGASCRVTIDGPNNAVDLLSLRMIVAFGAARQIIRIQTPYFLPSREIISALQAARLRGVEVEVILPQRNNLPYVHWATSAMLWELLQYGVAVYYVPGPFDHSKALLVDKGYSLVGSANIDPRSLRLNFEIGVEIWCAELANTLNSHLDELIGQARKLTPLDLKNRSLPVQIRDRIAWLFSPSL